MTDIQAKRFRKDNKITLICTDQFMYIKSEQKSNWKVIIVNDLKPN